MTLAISENKISEKCPFCGFKDTNMYNCSLAVWKCRSCGLLFKDVSLKESIEVNINAWQDLPSHKNETGATDLRLARIYLQKIISTLGIKSLSGLKILDFGTGKGDMLMALSELGADAYGIEPFGYGYLNHKGFKVFREMEEIPDGVLFDGIMINDVLEHLYCPWDVLKKLYGLLKVTGWLYIATPNSGSLNSRFFKQHWRELYNFGHIRFFNTACLETIFKRMAVTRYKRPRWLIEYSSNPLRKLIHYLLQLFRLDGVLRCILLRSQA